MAAWSKCRSLWLVILNKGKKDWQIDYMQHKTLIMVEQHFLEQIVKRMGCLKEMFIDVSPV